MEDEILRQFGQIEQKVEKIIQRCQSLETDNSKLSEKIRELEHQLSEKADAETRYAEQKTFIRSKIDNLLVRLESISEVQ